MVVTTSVDSSWMVGSGRLAVDDLACSPPHGLEEVQGYGMACYQDAEEMLQGLQRE